MTDFLIQIIKKLESYFSFPQILMWEMEHIYSFIWEHFNRKDHLTQPMRWEHGMDWTWELACKMEGGHQLSPRFSLFLSSSSPVSQTSSNPLIFFKSRRHDARWPSEEVTQTTAAKQILPSWVRGKHMIWIQWFCWIINMANCWVQNAYGSIMSVAQIQLVKMFVKRGWDVKAISEELLSSCRILASERITSVVH